MAFTKYFETRVLVKRLYSSKGMCVQAIEAPVRREANMGRAGTILRVHFRNRGSVTSALLPRRRAHDRQCISRPAIPKLVTNRTCHVADAVDIDLA